MSDNSISDALERGIDLKGRRIWLHGSVDEETIARAIRGLFLLSDVSKSEPIELFVSSYGGDLDEAFALHDATRVIRAPVHTIAIGKCMSAAPLLVACGATGHRYASESTTFMLHGVSIEVPEGRPVEIEAHVRAAREAQARYSELLGQYTKKPRAHWSRVFSAVADRFYTASEAVELGLVDQVWAEKD